MNKKEQHALGVAEAIKYYTVRGCAVFVPVSDHHRYDLVVDDGGLKRVEVKTTTSKVNEISLRTMGGNTSWSGEVKRISADDCDIVFAYNVNTDGFQVFEAKELEGRATVRVK